MQQNVVNSKTKNENKMKYLKYIYFLFFINFCLSGINAQSNDLLSVEETVSLAKTAYFDFIPEEDMLKRKLMNPDAKPILYNILNDQKQKEFWAQVIGAFAEIGEKEDIPLLIDFLRKREGMIDNYEFRATLMIFDVLGAMVYKEVNEADYVLNQMLVPEYWGKMNFTIFNKQPESYYSFENYMVVRVLYGYAYSKKQDFDLIVANTLNSIGNSDKKELFAFEAENIIEFYEEILKLSY